MAPDDFEHQVASIAALAEPVRRMLYQFVVAQPSPVSRDSAAAGVGVAHHVAKFHLDKLEEDGLLEAEYSRPPGRGGPGAGRPAKLYRRSSRPVAVSLPERRYDLAGRVLAEAITVARRTGVPVEQCLPTVATEMGRAIGEQAEQTETSPTVGSGGPRGSRAHSSPDGHQLERVGAILAAHGYEPRLGPGCITLRNCPFHSLAQDYTDLICALNLHLIDGILSALPPLDVRAELDPGPGHCCVAINASDARP